MELSELIANLLAKFSATPDEVFAALQSGAQPLYQRAFAAGHTAGLTKGRGEKAEVEARLTEVQGQLETAQTQLREVQERTPDTNAIRTQYQNEIKTLKDQHKTALQAEKDKRVNAEKDRAFATLQAKLGKGLNPLVARLLVQDKAVRDRIHVNEDGTLEVMQKGKEIPFSPADDQDVLDLFASELIADQPADFRLADGDSGSGVHTETVRTNSGKNEFDAIRDNAQKEREAAKAAGIKSLDEKMGFVGSAAS